MAAEFRTKSRASSTSSAPVKDDVTRDALVRALQCYDAEQFRASIAHGATALNLIAAKHDLGGGGWS